MKEKVWHHLTVAETATALRTPVDTGLQNMNVSTVEKSMVPTV